MRHFLTLLLALMSNFVIAQEFTKLYGNSITNGGRDFIETSDGNFLIAGVNGPDAMLMKVDFNGDMLWTKNYGGDKTDEFNSVIEDNGYYYICGNTASYTTDSVTDVFVVKTDLLGNVIWSRTFGGSGCAGAYCGDQGFKIIKESTNKFVIAGLSASAGNTNLMAGYIIKINESGTLLQDYVLDGGGSEFFFSVTLAENGDLIYTGQNKVGTWESWLLRMSPNGTVVYDLGYGDAGTLGGAAHEVLEHNGYTYMYMDNGDATVALVKLDALGDTITVKQYQGYNTKYMLLSEDANSLYLLGTTNNATTYLLKTDLQGDTIWTKHFYNLNGHALIEKEDSIYLLAAPPSGGNGGYDVALMKLASDGSTSNCYEYGFIDFFYNPYSIVITPYGEGISSIPFNYDVSIDNNNIDYNKCIKCISADFSYQVDNLEVFFTNESTLEVEYNWEFGDGSTDNTFNTNHQFSELGTYQVCLTALDSCSSEIVCQTIEITECQTEQSNAIITNCDSTYVWNGQTYNQSGEYTFNTINSSGCDSIAKLQLTLTNLNLGEDIESCEELIVLDAGEGYSSYSWSNGETTQTISINESNTYSVEVNSGTTYETTCGYTETQINDVSQWQYTDIIIPDGYSVYSIYAAFDRLLDVDDDASQDFIVEFYENYDSELNQWSNYFSLWDYSEISYGLYNTELIISDHSVYSINVPGMIRVSAPLVESAGHMWNDFCITLISDVYCIDEISVTFNSPSYSQTSVTQCDSTYVWNGQSYSQSGEYTYTTTNSSGCDSTATLNLSLSDIGIETSPSISGANAGVTQSQGNEYTITNAVLGLTYHWSITPNLGEIISSNNDSSVVEIIWGTIEGFTDLCAYEEDQYGCIGISRCVEVQIKRPTNINENTTIDFELYPNPFSDQTVLELKNNNGENVEINIIDFSGKVVRTYNKTENNRIIIERNGLANGLYFLYILTENGQAKDILIIK